MAVSNLVCRVIEQLLSTVILMNACALTLCRITIDKRVVAEPTVVALCWPTII